MDPPEIVQYTLPTYQRNDIRRSFFVVRFRRRQEYSGNPGTYNAVVNRLNGHEGIIIANPNRRFTGLSPARFSRFVNAFNERAIVDLSNRDLLFPFFNTARGMLAIDALYELGDPHHDPQFI